jgi:hypothetical protein
MATIKHEAPASISTIFTTELNSLADGGNKLSGALSNDAAGELYLYADFELFINTTSTRADDARVDLYILEELDGSNYTYGTDSIDPPGNAWVGSFLFDNTTATRYNHIRGVALPPTDFKVLLINELGVAMASSSNTLKWIKYNLQSA